MEVHSLTLRSGREVEVAEVGPDHGRPILYFHSPATSGEELDGAAIAAARWQVRLVSLRRPSIASDPADDFVAVVVTDVGGVIEALNLERSRVLAWSGGAPYALAAAARLGPAIDSVHLVSPVPGPLSGPDAVPHQSARLRQVADSDLTSSWVSGPLVLRDYRAVTAPWSFDVQSVTQPVTIWAPTEDEVVPPHLADHLAQQLPDGTVVAVAGAHDWLIEHWSTVLERTQG